MPKSGEKHPNSVLNESKVKRIRENPDNLNDYALARELGCDRATVRLVRLNATWHDPDYVPREAVQGRGRPRRNPPADKAVRPKESK